MDESIQKHLEADQQRRLGRIALDAIARHLDTYTGPFDMSDYRICALGVSRNLRELLATGLTFSSSGGTYFEGTHGDLADLAECRALGIDFHTWAQMIFGPALRYERGPKDVAQRIRDYLDRTV